MNYVMNGIPANVSTIDERIKSIYHSIVTSKCTRSQEEKFVDGIELSNKLTEGFGKRRK